MPIPRSIEELLAGRHLAYSVIHHPTAYTAREEAVAAHIPGREWAKTVVCLADDDPILAVVPAVTRVDIGRLRDVTGARDLRLASEREFERLFRDCELGAMPPLGPLYGPSVFIDRSLTDGHDIAFEAGSHSDAVRVKYDDFARVVHPTVGDFARTPGER